MCPEYLRRYSSELQKRMGTCAHLVYPQLAHNNVVHCCGNFLPSVVVPSCMENTVDATWKQREVHKLKQILEKISLYELEIRMG